MEAPLRVGDILHGFCGGAFGRDSYDMKRVEAVGSDWVVVRNSRNAAEWAATSPEDLVQYRLTPDQLAALDRDSY